MEFACVNGIGIDLICNTSNANLYNFERKPTQCDFRTLNNMIDTQALYKTSYSTLRIVD